MAKLQDAQAPYLTLTEQAAAPAAPAAGDHKLYTKTDGKLYRKDDAGTETEVGAGPGGSSTATLVQVYRSAALSIPASTETAIPFDAEDFDVDGFHSTGTNPERFTVPAGLAGVYRVTAQLSGKATSATAGQEFSLTLFVNGVGFAVTSAPVSLSPTSVALDTLVQLSAGDYVELRAYQNSGATLALFVTANRRYARLALERVS